MRKFFAALAVFVVSAAVVSAAKPKRVVILALDGVRVDGLAEASTPNLDALFASGAASYTTRDQMPSVTLPNFTSHLTGSGPEQHGVVNNRWKPDNMLIRPVITDDDGYYPGVFKVLKENVKDIKTGFYWNWKALINPHNRKYIDEASFLKKEWDEYEPNYDKCFEFLKANRKYPTFVFMYNVTSDHAGHKFGWMTPEYISALENCDKLIGRFLGKLKDEGLYDGTHFFFITDHGGMGKKHGKVSEAEMTVPWAVAGPMAKKGYVIKGPHYTTCTSVDVLHIFGLDKKVPSYWVGKNTKEAFRK